MGNTFGNIRQQREAKDAQARDRALRRDMLEYRMKRDQRGDDVRQEASELSQIDKDRKYRESVLERQSKADAASKKADTDTEKFAAEMDYKGKSLAQRGEAKQKQKYYDPNLGAITELTGTPEQHDAFLTKFKEVHGYEPTNVPDKEKGFNASDWVKVEMPTGVDSTGKAVGTAVTYVPPARYADFIQDAAKKIGSVKKPDEGVSIYPAPSMPTGQAPQPTPPRSAPFVAPASPALQSAAQTPAITTNGMPDAPTTPLDRVTGQTYKTPKGAMKWTGTGWLPQQ